MSERAPGSGPWWPGARRSGSAGTGSAALAFIAVALIASTMRAPITVAGPLLPAVAESVGTLALAGLLVSLPLVAFSLAAPLFPALLRRVTLPRAVQLALLVLAVGLILRQGVQTMPLLAGTALVGVGIASLNVALPVIVKSRWPHAVALMTGLFTSITAIAASLAAGVALPLANARGWPQSLGSVGAMVGLAALGAALLVPKIAPAGVFTKHHPTGPGLVELLRHPTTFALVGLMAVQAGTYYCLVSWLPAALLDDGLSEASVATAQSVFVLLSVVAGPLAGWWLQSARGVRWLAIVATAPLSIALVGLAFLPDAVWLWVVLAGASCGAIFAVTLALFGVKSDSAAVTAKLSALGHVCGYAIAAMMPPLMGALFTATGLWALVLVVLAGLAAAQCGVALLAVRATVILDAHARAPRPPTSTPDG